jgi:hypothetical protein
MYLCTELTLLPFCFSLQYITKCNQSRRPRHPERNATALVQNDAAAILNQNQTPPPPHD